MDQAGRTWVKDQRVKAGGYWRKNKEGIKKRAAAALPGALAATAIMGASLYARKQQQELNDIMKDVPSADEFIRTQGRNAAREAEVSRKAKEEAENSEFVRTIKEELRKRDANPKKTRRSGAIHL